MAAERAPRPYRSLVTAALLPIAAAISFADLTALFLIHASTAKACAVAPVAILSLSPPAAVLRKLIRGGL
jgi:hypothetical protein